jgi:hypothetical protein
MENALIKRTLRVTYIFIYSNLPYANAFAAINEIKSRPIGIRPIALHRERTA